MNCPRCGYPHAHEGKPCPNCGAEVKRETPSRATGRRRARRARR